MGDSYYEYLRLNETGDVGVGGYSAQSNVKLMTVAKYVMSKIEPDDFEGLTL